VENAEVARLFRELADLLEIEGANPYRVRAYRNAARTIENYPEPLAELAHRTPERLTDLPAIGEDLAHKITELVTTGSLAALAEARRRVPRGLASLLRLRGLGPKRVRMLFHELGVDSARALRAACLTGRVRELDGFGKRLELQLLHDLTEHRDEEHRLSRAVATQYADALLEYLRGAPGITHIEWAGSFRRRKDTVGDLDLLVTARRAEEVTRRFLAYPEAEAVLARGTTRAEIRLRNGLQVDLRVLEPPGYGAGLFYFTGSKAHNIAVRRLAQERGLKLNEYGVWRGDVRIAGRTEREVARAVGLPFIPPELREDRGEIAAALTGTLPHLVTLEDIRGDLQCHTTDSDGRDGLVEMARAARALGREYLAITDHTPHLRVTGGLDRAGFRRQATEIATLNDSLRGLTVLSGAEVDILKDGTLDLDDETLWSLDVVVAAVHSSLTLPRREQTRRILRALAHPAVDILAHPTGRLLSRRAGMDLDFDEIARAAADRGIMLEVNAQPDRLDLDDLAITAALRHGARLVISTDAHDQHELGFMHWGVDQARRGWATASDVVNCRALSQLRRRLHQHRGGRRPAQVRGARRDTVRSGNAPATPATRRPPRRPAPGPRA
jgi:DNA polymerase (family 10)